MQGRGSFANVPDFNEKMLPKTLLKGFSKEEKKDAISLLKDVSFRVSKTTEIVADFFPGAPNNLGFVRKKIQLSSLQC